MSDQFADLNKVLSPNFEQCLSAFNGFTVTDSHILIFQAAFTFAVGLFSMFLIVCYIIRRDLICKVRHLEKRLEESANV